MDVFNKYAQVKDIRLVKGKDFAFVEFFTIEEAQQILDRAKTEKIRVNGVPVFVAFSKFKRPEQYVI